MEKVQGTEVPWDDFKDVFYIKRPSFPVFSCLWLFSIGILGLYPLSIAIDEGKLLPILLFFILLTPLLVSIFSIYDYVGHNTKNQPYIAMNDHGLLHRVAYAYRFVKWTEIESINRKLFVGTDTASYRIKFVWKNSSRNNWFNSNFGYSTINVYNLAQQDTLIAKINEYLNCSASPPPLPQPLP